MKSIFRVMLFFILILSWTEVTHATEKISVFTSIEPVAYIIEQIVTDYVDVQALVTQGQNLHTFEPSPKQIAKLGKAHFFFKIGLPFENHILKKIKATHQKLIISDASKNIKFRFTKDKHQEKHQEKHQDDNNKDPHIWLGISQIKTIAKNITKVFINFDFENSKVYKKNLNSFLAKLNIVNKKILDKLAPYDGRKVVMFHPAFGYFTDSYNLIQETVEMNGKSPTPKQLSYLIGNAIKDKIKVVFVQPQFDSTGANVIANAINGKVVPLNPLAKNLLNNLYNMGNKIANSLHEFSDN